VRAEAVTATLLSGLEDDERKQLLDLLRSLLDHHHGLRGYRAE
jgi:hypothetical protein